MTDVELSIAAIRDVAEGVAAAIGRRDIATLRSLLANGFAHRTHGGDATDLEAFLRGIEQIPGDIDFVTLEDLAIDVYPGGALATGFQHAHVTVDGQGITDRRRFIDWFVLEDGRWRILAAVDVPGTDETPAEPSAAPAGQHYFDHGALSYVQLPAIDVKASAKFYEAIFGWTIRGGSDSHYSFTDPRGHVIGAWVTGRDAAASPGVILYIYVYDLDATLAQVAAHGCAIVKPRYVEGDVLVATFRDPAGNVIGAWQKAP